MRDYCVSRFLRFWAYKRFSREDPQRVSAAILLSTIVSVVSFPCVAWLALD
jgi:hypothetical protein